MTDVIYLAPLCQEHERMWCEHDAPVDCECIDGPHPWVKYVAAPKQPTQSDVELVARALAQADRIEICSDATYALSSYGHKAQAALAAMRQPTQSDVSFRELAAVLYRKSADFQVGLTVADSYTLAAEAIAFLQEQSR